jgi:hypothetical protein
MDFFGLLAVAGLTALPARLKRLRTCRGGFAALVLRLLWLLSDASLIPMLASWESPAELL